jgi:transposase
MRSLHAAVMIQMNQQTRATLHGWLHSEMSPLSRAKRAQPMLVLEQGHRYTHTARRVGLTERNLHKWARRFHGRGLAGLDDSPRPGRTPVFSHEVALYTVKLACERPDDSGCSLSQWDCPELARRLKADCVVQTISASNRWAELGLPQAQTVATPSLARSLGAPWCPFCPLGPYPGRAVHPSASARRRWSSVSMRRPTSNRVLVWLLPYRLDQGNPCVWKTNTSASEPCTCLPPLIPLPAKSTLGLRGANGKPSS